MNQHRQRQDTTGKIAGLTLVNAMVFQEILADYESQVHHLRQILQDPDAVRAFSDHWQYVLHHINYYPIFQAAYQLLLALPSNPETEQAIRQLADTAREIVRQRAALRHDLMGRVYHTLLADSKYLGTYYTSVPAATLLLKLALAPHRWNLDWSDLDTLSDLRIGDLACGTGTLLMAAAEAVTDNYLRASAERLLRVDLSLLSQRLMEDIIYGYDVLLSALHLTASTLALRAPEITFRRMHLWSLPFGDQNRRLGSIEFLRATRPDDAHPYQIPIVTDMFGASALPSQVTGSGTARDQVASLPDLDLCVMNPPFTRSAQPNLLFGSIHEPVERQALQRELASLLRRRRVLASSTAGLGAVFVAVSDRHIKVGGRLALVLPKPLLSGVAWGKTRQLLRQLYQVEYIIVSHDPERWNFSDNTDLSEVLVVARKLRRLEEAGSDLPDTAEPVVSVNLWKNPGTAVEALSLAHSLLDARPPDLAGTQGTQELSIGETKIGEVVSTPWAELRTGNWMLPSAYGQTDLVRATYHLAQGSVMLPGSQPQARIPLCPLGDLVTIGPDPRDVYDGFDLSARPTPYPAVWGHDAAVFRTMAQAPNNHLVPLAAARRGRPLRLASVLWPRSGRLLLSQRPWLNTKSVSAVLLDSQVLSDVWWPLSLLKGDSETEKALAIWFNGTLGLMLLWANREETRGAWVQFKKPVLSALPVLDVFALPATARQALAQAYDNLCQQALCPFPQMGIDPVRAAIDEAISGVLGLPSLAPLRAMLGREPVVCLSPL